MKQILVPIDFSPFSEWAFLSALAIAEKIGASITCINVVTSHLDWKNLSINEWVNHPEIMDREAEARENLDAFIRNRHRLPAIPVEAVVEVGIPYEMIVNAVRQREVDLVVIGAYGKGYQKGHFIGSNLQKVLRQAPCPVLAVKKVLDGPALESMVYASLFNEVSKSAFSQMLLFIKAMAASVNFLYVNLLDNPRDRSAVMSKMERYAGGEDGLIVRKDIYDHQEIEDGIIEYATNNGIGWIGIATNTRKTSGTYSIGVTETVIFKAAIPVLSVKF